MAGVLLYIKKHLSRRERRPLLSLEASQFGYLSGLALSISVPILVSSILVVQFWRNYLDTLCLSFHLSKLERVSTQQGLGKDCMR